MREEPRSGFKGKDNSLSRVPMSLREAFGIDGERAVEVARLITSSRRIEAEKENNYFYDSTGES